VIFRFVSILGERYTHGHVFDFTAALRRDPAHLRVLGDGRQEKSYLYVGDCVEAMLTALAHHDAPGAAAYNLGTDETLVVDDSVAEICAALGVEPAIEHTGGRRGWAGDSPLIHLDTARIRALGWSPRLSIREAVRRTVAWLEANPAVLEGRAAA
jgi:UDP-glucose 4-epimerase